MVGGGFAGLAAARALGREPEVDVTLVDRRNHHLFQPLLYQVATAGLSPAEIAAPIRSLLSRFPNVRVLRSEATRVDLAARTLHTDAGPLPYDYLVLACGARHAYFGHEEWEPFAPGLKTIEQATEIRRRVLDAFEEAEKETDRARQRALLTFVIVGGGPTGVELAGAIGEMSRFTLAKDFRRIDPKLARIILIEAAPRILPMLAPELASRAVRDLEWLGVQVWTSSPVTNVDAKGVEVGAERIESATVLWAAGVRAEALGRTLGVELGPGGRVPVGPDLRLPGHREVFVAGDLALRRATRRPRAARRSRRSRCSRAASSRARSAASCAASPPRAFHYVDRGTLATIGRSRAVGQVGRWQVTRRLRLAGLAARPHLLPGRLQEPPGRRDPVGVVVLPLPARRAPDRRTRSGASTTR